MFESCRGPAMNGIHAVLSLLVCLATLSLANGSSCQKYPSGPVCSLQGVTFASACEAHAAAALIAYPGSCHEACSTACPNEAWRPVCIGEGAAATTYGSPCFATCNNQTGFADEDAGAACRTKEGCMCIMLYQPVCGADGKNYSNSGCADCAEVPVKHEGECSPSDQPPAGQQSQDECDANCTGSRGGIIDPVCLVKRGGNSTSFKNPCYAKCKAGIKPSDFYYKGYVDGCDAKCDQQCKPWKPNGRPRGSKYIDRVCCGSGEEFPSACYAECLGNYSSGQCSKGQCTGERAVNLLSWTCSQGSVAARCLADPCQSPSCKAKGATCVANYCTKFFRLAYVGALCEAVWLDPKKGNLVQPTCPP